MSSRINKNNVLAALFLLGSLGLAVWVSFMLKRSSGVSGPSLPFTVRFTLAQGASGIKPGSAVLLGGQQIGRVSRVSFAQTDLPGGPRPVGVDVHCEVRGDMPIFENALVLLELPLLGNISSINIGSVGDIAATPTSGTPRLEPNETIAGVVAPPAFLAQSGFGPDQVGQLRQAITSFSAAVDRGSALLDSLSPKLDTAASEMATMLADLRANLDSWSKKLDPILTKTEALVADAGAAAKDVRDLVSTNREKVDSILVSVDAAASKVNTTTVDELNAALTKGREALDSVTQSTDRLGSLLTTETPNLRRILANLRLMSDQLKLTAIEVRSQPWRLLIQPTTKEFESQVLYDATRAYATAASDLRGASEALEALLAKGSAATEAEKASIAELSGRLKEAFTKYRDAEQGLLDKLIEKNK
jgi:ABC-type transporter Mla subunit MlaD